MPAMAGEAFSFPYRSMDIFSCRLYFLFQPLVAWKAKGTGLTQQPVRNLTAMRIVAGHALIVLNRAMDFHRRPDITDGEGGGGDGERGRGGSCPLDPFSQADPCTKSARQRLVALAAQAHLSIIPDEHIFVVTGMGIMTFHALSILDRGMQGCTPQLFL